MIDITRLGIAVDATSAKQQRLAADAADRSFFAANPNRGYRARPSIELEGEGWTADSHITRPVMVVARMIPGRRKFNRIALAATDHGVPDHELFLSLLWRHIATMGSVGRGISISPQTHRQLLDVAGIAKGERQ